MTSLPCIASKMKDDLGVGAILKHVEKDDYRAVLIDWVGSDPTAVAVTADFSSVEADEADPRIEDYCRSLTDKRIKKLIKNGKHPYKIELLDLDKWIVLDRGSENELLIE